MSSKMCKITLEEIKNIQIDILKEIDTLCKNNGLKYSLAGGSLIGVIRHKGFIPWDDDVDIMMPRPDYEKLKKIIIDNPVNGLKYMSNDIQSDYYYPYAKVVSTKTTVKEYKSLEIDDYGVFIDIFPIDGTYKNKINRFFQLKKIGVLRNLLQLSFHEEQVSNSVIKKNIKKIIALFAKKIGFKKLVNYIDKLMKKCEYSTSKYVTLLYCDIAIKKGKIYEKNIFENTIRKSFEKINVSVIENYDIFLKDTYGDYMKFPPKEQQISNHYFDRIEWKINASQ